VINNQDTINYFAEQEAKNVQEAIKARGETPPEQIIWARDFFERFNIRSYAQLLALKQKLADRHITFNLITTPLTPELLAKIGMNTMGGRIQVTSDGFNLDIN